MNKRSLKMLLEWGMPLSKGERERKCVCVCAPVCVCTHVLLHTYLFLYLFIHLFIYLFIYLFTTYVYYVYDVLYHEQTWKSLKSTRGLQHGIFQRKMSQMFLRKRMIRPPQYTKRHHMSISFTSPEWCLSRLAHLNMLSILKMAYTAGMAVHLKNKYLTHICPLCWNLRVLSETRLISWHSVYLILWCHLLTFSWILMEWDDSFVHYSNIWLTIASLCMIFLCQHYHHCKLDGQWRTYANELPLI